MVYMWKFPIKSWLLQGRSIRRLAHYGSKKNDSNQSSGLRKVLYELKSSASDEELRKNILEFEKKLVELQESENLRKLSGAFSKSMVSEFVSSKF